MSYLSTILADSPRQYWRLADGGGKLAHDIGSNARVLVASTDDLLGYSGVSSNGGAMFNQTQQSISGLGAISSLATPLSLEAWFWLTGTPPSNGYVVAWSSTAAGSTSIFVNTTLGVVFTMNATTATYAGPVSTQAWHHVVGTYDNANMRLYIDAVLQATTALAGPFTISQTFAIGANPTGSGSPLQACICEVAIYPAALSAGRITAHHSAAEIPSSVPVWTQISGNGGTNPPTELPPGLEDITKFVSQTYQNTP